MLPTFRQADLAKNLSTINMEGKDTTQGDTLETKVDKIIDEKQVNEVTKLKEDNGASMNPGITTPLKIDTDKENENNKSDLTSTLGLQDEEAIPLKVIYNKNKYDVNFPLNQTVMQLKHHLQNIIGVPRAMQKVMIKGLAKDDRTLKELGVTKGAKIMVVGSKLDDVLSVSTPSQLDLSQEKAATSTKEPFCKQKIHRKVLDAGVPDDVMPGIKNIKLHRFPNGKVRFTFKLEMDQLWIGTKERTDKIPMHSIKNVVSEAIEDHEEYHIMALQLGPTEASRYWVYWVPAQYVDAIKDAILGTWPL
ncbi:hypothetical protein RUM44_002901 [Polyplax serrata]|uniref:Ubiquitin-like domain-containing protein n=1 Tax=Polyplax serrata TaxID=468196 RepID=A0ABR1AX43_POLSC